MAIRTVSPCRTFEDWGQPKEARWYAYPALWLICIMLSIAEALEQHLDRRWGQKA